MATKLAQQNSGRVQLVGKPIVRPGAPGGGPVPLPGGGSGGPPEAHGLLQAIRQFDLAHNSGIGPNQARQSEPNMPMNHGGNATAWTSLHPHQQMALLQHWMQNGGLDAAHDAGYDNPLIHQMMQQLMGGAGPLGGQGFQPGGGSGGPPVATPLGEGPDPRQGPTARSVQLLPIRGRGGPVSLLPAGGNGPMMR